SVGPEHPRSRNHSGTAQLPGQFVGTRVPPTLVNSRVFVEHGLHLGRTDPVTVGQDRSVITGRKVQPPLTIHDAGVTRQVEGAVRGETHLRSALVVHIAVEPGQGTLRQVDPYPSIDAQRGRFVINSL